jgi:hypothetical protein
VFAEDVEDVVAVDVVAPAAPPLLDAGAPLLAVAAPLAVVVELCAVGLSAVLVAVSLLFEPLPEQAMPSPMSHSTA